MPTTWPTLPRRVPQRVMTRHATTSSDDIHSPLKTDVIIPARDEAATIYDVVREFAQHDYICCVNVVIDMDDLGDTVKQLPTTYPNVYVRMPPLNGKGQLLQHALDYVGTERVIFCDSDLSGLNAHHIDYLTQNNRDGMIVGVPDYPTDLSDTEPHDVRAINAWPYVSGERSLPTSWARNAGPLHGYLVETQLNNYARKWLRPIWYERLEGVKAPWRMTARRIWEMERDRKWGKEHGIL
jgi:glycosyltransferase involved in cell wall biosynthesis